jgi:DNA-binding response OmpR family regulator
VIYYDEDVEVIMYVKIFRTRCNMPETFNGKTILLVDDEKDITDLLEEVLIRDGFKNIIKANNGLSAVELCKTHSPDVIVLDIMLPDIDGIEVCKRIREFSYCSILFLSSKNDDIDKILGLSSGGDDYVTKPFSPREIGFRIKSQLRRQEYHNPNCSNNGNYTFIASGKLKIDVEGSRVYKDERELPLTGREFLLLCYMAQNAGKIISKERLYEQVWGELSSICDNTIMVHIRHLREKLENDPSNPQIIITIKGLGYKFVRS